MSRSVSPKPVVPAKKAVGDLIAALPEPQASLAAAIRDLILQSDAGFTEHIKWNAPSFCHGGTDRITFQLRRPGVVMLVFHTGAKGEARPVSRNTLPDPGGLLHWAAADRATATFGSLPELEAAATALGLLVRHWVGAV